MANEVPASVSAPFPRPPAAKERPSLVAGREPSPEERHGTIGAARNPLVPPAGSVESRLDDAAREALANAAMEGALGIMTYGKSAAKLVAPSVLKRFSRTHPNASAHALRRETGYQRGLFGYGVETHGDATLKPRAVWNLGAQKGTLGELAYVSREMDVAYPGMSDTPLSIVPDSEWKPYLDTMRADLPPWAYTSNGFAAPDGGVVLRGIRPGETMETYASRADATLNHELQHIAQTADGVRPPYPHPDRDAYMRDAREVDARNTADRHVFTPADRDLFLRSATQDTPAELVNLDDKGGDNYGSFRNFLATDDVPDSLFGIPVVQDESQYTEADIRFFKENPKAAGFYDMGDEDAEDIPRQAAKARSTRGKYPGLTNNPGNVQKHELRTDKTLFEGEDGGGARPKRFARFTDPVLGLKAAATVLAGYANAFAKEGKKFTIENYAPIYAPRKENDTEAYIGNISRYSGIARDAEIDRWDVKGLARMLKAKVRFETSPEASEWFTDKEYEEAAEKLQEGAFD